jgi:branched-subunit amino acid aminotransferase/4-amino-4-deoxychorismate lyase
VTRAAKLAADPTAGEEPIGLARLMQADEVFLTSSVAGQRTATLELTPVLS